MKKIYISLVYLFSTLSLMVPLKAFSKDNLLNLNDFLSLARQNDSELLSSLAAKNAASEAKAQGVAGLLPVITYSYQSMPGSQTDTKKYPSSGPWSSTTYDQRVKNISLRQPLFRPRNWINFYQGFNQAEMADQKFRYSRYQATLRAIDTYGNWLLAKQKITLLDSKLKAYESRHQQTDRLYKAGENFRAEALITLADVERTKLELEQAKKDFSYIQEFASGIIKNKTELGSIPDPLTLNTLSLPYTIEEAINLADSNNPELLASKLAIEIAQKEYRKTLADHLPTVDFVANQSNTISGSESLLGTQYKTQQAGIMLTVPIFNGGATLSTTRQAGYGVEKAKYDHESLRNRIISDLTKSYNALKELKQKWISAKASHKAYTDYLSAISKQKNAGAKTRYDVENARHMLEQSNFDITQSKADWILGLASIKATIGELDIIEGDEINSLIIGKNGTVDKP